MDMIKPVKTDDMRSAGRAGRPVCERTLEIMGELKVAATLGKATVVIPLSDDETGVFARFSARARNAARMCGLKVSVRRLDDERARLVLMDGGSNEG